MLSDFKNNDPATITSVLPFPDHPSILAKQAVRYLMLITGVSLIFGWLLLGYF
jgi:hypothetical protein